MTYNNQIKYKLVLIRHGESIWNQENRFTGWTDIGLSEKGLAEAHYAGKILKENNFIFDIAYTSVLQRAKRTLSIILDEMNLNIPVYTSYKLNERYYGALQGLNKQETIKKYGEKQVLMWRRSLEVYPPAVALDDARYPGNHEMYKKIPSSELPTTENLLDTINRVIPYYETVICPTIQSGKRVIISAHGNSLRALVKVLDNLSDDEIMELNIPTGVPLVYELTDCLTPVSRYYL